MRIGVLSDTHIALPRGSLGRALARARSGPDPLAALQEILDRHLAGVDRIIHLGDFTAPEVADLLAARAPLDAVWGNMDGPDIRRRFPAQRVLELGPFRVGLFHGQGPPVGIVERVAARFPEPLDAVLFGHSHRPLCRRRGRTLFLNPGSPTDRVFAPYRSVAILEAGDRLEARIVRVEPG